MAVQPSYGSDAGAGPCGRVGCGAGCAGQPGERQRLQEALPGGRPGRSWRKPNAEASHTGVDVGDRSRILRIVGDLVLGRRDRAEHFVDVVLDPLEARRDETRLNGRDGSQRPRGHRPRAMGRVSALLDRSESPVGSYWKSVTSQVAKSLLMRMRKVGALPPLTSRCVTP
jgi:hypothetical protein